MAKLLGNSVLLLLGIISIIILYGGTFLILVLAHIVDVAHCIVSVKYRHTVIQGNWPSVFTFVNSLIKRREVS